MDPDSPISSNSPRVIINPPPGFDRSQYQSFDWKPWPEEDPEAYPRERRTVKLSFDGVVSIRSTGGMNALRDVWWMQPKNLGNLQELYRAFKLVKATDRARGLLSPRELYHTDGLPNDISLKFPNHRIVWRSGWQHGDKKYGIKISFRPGAHAYYANHLPAILAHASRGAAPAMHPCDSCVKGSGPFEECTQVVSRDIQPGEEHFEWKGVCTNCYFNGRVNPTKGAGGPGSHREPCSLRDPQAPEYGDGDGLELELLGDGLDDFRVVF
jgi:hypothetical protein